MCLKTRANKRGHEWWIFCLLVVCFARFSLNHLLRMEQLNKVRNANKMTMEQTRKRKRPRKKREWTLNTRIDDSFGWFHSHCLHTYVYQCIFSILWLLKIRRNIYVINEGISNMMSLLRYKWRLNLIFIPLILTFQGINPFKNCWQ